ncbi:MAG: insulinase family protein [Bacteroidetes bacterium]|nr:insulinase family protein [Bacteroidota bacterium]MBU2506751.1 insulinase family protein [Bacteroidota bacterium]
MSDILKINYKKFVLNNGLEVVLYKDNSLPLTAVNLWYKVGSANEAPGKTGFAHLFEHMMFQGSRNVPKEKHFQYIQEAGGSLNGSTSLDRTNYYETVPSDSLELALWLESDRMGFLLPSLTEEKLQNQKDVVMNERRQRCDNQPYGLAWELIFKNVFPENHPYHSPTIGWMEDIEKFNLDDVKQFFKTYYSPNNCSLVVAGNIEYSSAEKSVRKYFEEINSSETIPNVAIPEFEIKLNSEFVHYDNVQLPRIYLVWKSDKLYGIDDASLDMTADILGGSKNSRLNKRLHFDLDLVQDVSCFQYSANREGLFVIVATAKPGVSLDSIKAEIFNILEKFKSAGPEQQEILKSKNSNNSTFIYSLQKIDGLADQINGYNCTLEEPNSFIYDLERYTLVNEETIKFVSQNYLSKQFFELRIVPKNENK